MTTPKLLDMALASLGELRRCYPVVVVDTREQTPLPLTCPHVRGTLYTGDYSVAGMEDYVAIERKSIPDIYQCVTAGRERFEHELLRLRGYRFRRLVIIGTPAEIMRGLRHTRTAPQAVLASLAAWEVRYDVPIVYVATPAEGAQLVERWAWWLAREAVLAANGLVRGCGLSRSPAPKGTPISQDK